MSKTLAPPAPPQAKDVMYTEKSGILREIRKATNEAIRIGMPVTLSNVVMTVERAEDLLSLNQKNRHKSIEKASDHAYKMRTGKWKNWGDSLHIARPEEDENGRGMRLLNGQHRLNGFIMAASAIEEKNKQLKKEGKPQIVVMWNIVCGLDHDDMSVIDTQKRRTAADWASIEGYSNANNLTTAVRLVILLVKGKVAGRVGGEMVSTDDVQEFLSSKTRKDKIVGYTATAVSKYRHEAKFLSPAQWAALHYTLAERNKEAGGIQADQFIKLLVSGDKLDSSSPKTSSVYHLRKILEKIMPTPRERGVAIKAQAQDITFRKFYHIYKAWNKFVAGKLTTESDLQLSKEDKASTVLPYLSK